MPRCPKCSYILVLLERRNKYKCAKCGKLFLKKEIDDKEFKQWNRRQRQDDKEKFEKQLKLRRKTLKPQGRKKVDSKEQQKNLLEYRTAKYNENKEIYKKINLNYYKKNREILTAKARHRYDQNKQAILNRNRKWKAKNKEKVKHTKTLYRKENIDQTRLNQRINDWRQAQKRLATQYYPYFTAHYSTFRTTVQEHPSSSQELFL